MEKKALESLVKELQTQVEALRQEVAMLRIQTTHVPPYVQPTTTLPQPPWLPGQPTLPATMPITFYGNTW